MTAAQTAAKAKFKKAIAYRQKTGVSLKEAFAHVYGKKVGAAPKKKAAKKAAPKKSAKKVVKKAAPKKAAPKKHTKYGKVKAHTRRVAGVKKAESIHKDTKSHNVNIRVMSGIGKVDKGLFKNLPELKAFHKEKGGHFFDRQTMKFFSTKIESTLIGGKYFIYSNKMPYYDRYYKIAEGYPSGNVFPLENSPQFESKIKAKEYLLKKVLKH
jgi:hypothetical protein